MVSHMQTELPEYGAPESRARPLITVVVPLIDTRGDAAEHVRSWTQNQSLARERYQVIVASPPGDPELQRQVGAILTPHDRMLLVERDEVGLYDAAAEQADADWLLPTESHCLGHSDCLSEVTNAIAEDRDLEALTLDHGHIVHNPVDRLCARWFGDVYETWEHPNEWARLNLVGFAIRRDAYHEEGGLDHRYGLFCSFLLAARMNVRGARIRHVTEARVDHVHTHSIREHHEHTADFAHGACAARSDLDTVFCERYFGHAHTWANAARYRREVARSMALSLARSSLHAAREHPTALPGRIREVASWLPAAVFGVRPHLAWRRWRFRAFELAAERLPLPADAGLRRYRRALDEVEQVAELEWIRAHDTRRTSELPAYGRWSIEELDGMLTPAHGLETHEARPFRWTEPACLLYRKGGDDSGDELRIDTGGLRGGPLGYVQDVYVGSRRIHRQLLHEQDDRVLRVPLPADGNGKAATPIVLILKPLLPTRRGSVDDRRLGMPVFSLELLPRV
jgi:hypothetical protein